MLPDVKGTFTNDNPRFRKAYIRERLAALKAERETLVAERDQIDQLLTEGKSLQATRSKANNSAR